MRFNPEKYTFGLRVGKFLDFYPFNGMLTSLSHFVAKSAKHALPLFKLMQKEDKFEWTVECDKALIHLKQALSRPTFLYRPDNGEVLYLVVAVETVSATLV